MDEEHQYLEVKMELNPADYVVELLEHNQSVMVKNSIVKYYSDFSILQPAKEQHFQFEVDKETTSLM
ncbi:hypothetical protein ACOSQ3_013563 [Xanthoceras sorbifolium]